jgi:hypothetical protein
MAFIPPLPSRWRPPEDYCDLGQDENPKVWLPVALGMLLVLLLLIVATFQGRL